MAWRIDFTKQADKALVKLDKSISGRILDEIEAIGKLENPRSRGRAFTGTFAGLWRYRVGDYRIICDIEDDVLLVLVVDVAHRKEAYLRKR